MLAPSLLNENDPSSCNLHIPYVATASSPALDLLKELLALQDVLPGPEFFSTLGAELPYLADPSVSAADVLDVLREARPEELDCCMDGLELSVRARLPDVLALHAVVPDEGSVFWWGLHADQPPSRGYARSMVLCEARREDCVLKFIEGALHIIPVRWLDLWVQSGEQLV